MRKHGTRETAEKGDYYEIIDDLPKNLHFQLLIMHLTLTPNPSFGPTYVGKPRFTVQLQRWANNGRCLNESMQCRMHAQLP